MHLNLASKIKVNIFFKENKYKDILDEVTVILVPYSTLSWCKYINVNQQFFILINRADFIICQKKLKYIYFQGLKA